MGGFSYAGVINGVNCVWAASQPNAWYENNSGIYGYAGGWDVNSNASLPWGYILGASLDETTLQNAVLDRARGLKADMLLNAVEANQMWPSIKSIATSLPAMAANWYQMRKVIKTASGAFLAWKFGVSPVLQDMMAVHRYLPRIQEDVLRHAKGDKQRFSITAERVLTSTDGVYYQSSQNGFVVQRFSRQSKVVKPPVVRYVLVVKPSTKYHTAFMSKADLFMRRFATSPASLAWELVPFSFVLDWFVDLRGTLRNLDKLIGFEPFKISSFTRSFSYELQSDYYLETLSPCNGSQLQFFRQCSGSYRHYERSTGFTTGALPSWNPRFGKNQAGISAALIAQQLSKLAGAKRR
jgi:hypothetical protein